MDRDELRAVIERALAGRVDISDADLQRLTDAVLDYAEDCEVLS